MKKVLMILSVLSVAFFCSCKKNHSTDLKPSLNVADNIVIAEEAYNHILLATINAWRNPLLRSQGLVYQDSGYVTYDSVRNRITLYYLNKLSPDSIARNGSVYIDMHGDILVKGSYALLTFNGYRSDVQTIYGYDSLSNEGQGAGGMISLVNYVRDGVVANDTGIFILWQCTNRFTMDPSVFSGGGGNYNVFLTGYASGTSTEGYHFTVSTSDSLVYPSECSWAIGDKLKFSLPGVDITTGIIYYNNGTTCSDQLTYDFEGNLFYSRMNYKFLKH